MLARLLLVSFYWVRRQMPHHLIPLFLALTLFSGAQNIFAQSASAPEATSSRPAVSPQSTPEFSDLQVARQQVKLLESQLQAVRDFQGAILDTIYWALGGVFLALSLVFGFSWFTNFRLYDRDKQALHADLQGRTDAALKELQAELDRTSLNLDRRFDEKLAEFNRTIETQVEHIREQLKTTSQASITAIERSLAGVQRSILRLQVRTEVDPAQRMTLAQRLLYYTTEAASDEVPEAISAILRAIDEGVRVTTREVASLNALLDKVKPEHSAFANKLREKLVNVSIV